MGCPVARLAQTWPKTFRINGNGLILVFLAAREKKRTKEHFFVIARDRRTAPPNPAGGGFVLLVRRHTRRCLHVNSAERKLLPKNHPASGGVFLGYRMRVAASAERTVSSIGIANRRTQFLNSKPRGGVRGWVLFGGHLGDRSETTSDSDREWSMSYVMAILCIWSLQRLPFLAMP